MSRTAILLTITLFVTAAPMALPAAGACDPVADNTVTPVVTPTATLYVKSTPFALRPGVAAPVPTHVWRETNGIPGLQPNSEYACGQQPDFEQAETNF